MKKFLPLILIIVIPLFFIFRSSTGNIKGSIDNKLDYSHLTIFSTLTCPHCKVVKDYINQNNININVIDITSINEQNQFQQAVSSCSPPQKLEETGVPFLFNPNDNSCIMGDTPIIDYLENNKPQ